MAARPLRPATDRRPGEPLPHQLANRPQAPPLAPLGFPFWSLHQKSYAGLARISAGCPPLKARLLTCSSPVRHAAQVPLPASDLHVLRTPPALVLSQDQTRHQKFNAAHDGDWRLWPSLHWLAQVSYRVLCLYAVCCFPLFNCSGASPAEPGAPSHLRIAQRRAYHDPPSMSRSPPNFSRCAYTVAGKGCCENVSASGVRSITWRYHVAYGSRIVSPGACAPVIDCV